MKDEKTKVISIEEHQKRIDDILDYYASKTGHRKSETPIQDKFEELAVLRECAEAYARLFTTTRGFIASIQMQSGLIVKLYEHAQPAMTDDEIIAAANTVEKIGENLEYHSTIYDSCMKEFFEVTESLKKYLNRKES